MSKLTYEDKINIYQERKQGNTLDSISKKYGVSVDSIMKLNNLTSSSLSIGQILKIKEI